MSDALDYLLKARPDALKGYFQYFRESGKNLDPKTRALLSILTKVAAQTEDGFRQYLSRGLQAGLRANEILDAMLVSLPMLGLTKILWAVDLLIEMDLPQFDLRSLSDSDPVWHRVCRLDDLKPGMVTRLACDNRELFVRADAEDFRVYDSRCPHQVTNIPALAIDGDQLTCPRHGWRFDLASGDCIANGDRPLRHFEARVDDGWLMAYW